MLKQRRPDSGSPKDNRLESAKGRTTELGTFDRKVSPRIRGDRFPKLALCKLQQLNATLAESTVICAIESGPLISEHDPYFLAAQLMTEELSTERSGNRVYFGKRGFEIFRMSEIGLRRKVSTSTTNTYRCSSVKISATAIAPKQTVGTSLLSPLLSLEVRTSEESAHEQD